MLNLVVWKETARLLKVNINILRTCSEPVEQRGRGLFM